MGLRYLTKRPYTLNQMTLSRKHLFPSPAKAFSLYGHLKASRGWKIHHDPPCIVGDFMDVIFLFVVLFENGSDSKRLDFRVQSNWYWCWYVQLLVWVDETLGTRLANVAQQLHSNKRRKTITT